MAQKIEIPGVGSYPLWATEDSLRDLIKAIGGLAPKGGAAGAGGQGAGSAKDDPQKASKMLAESLGEVDDESKKLIKRFGSLYDENGKKKLSGFEAGIAGSVNSLKQMTNMAAGFSDITSVTSLAGGAMVEFAAAAGPLAPLVVAVGGAFMLLADLLGQYNKILGQAIDVGLGYSDSLGKAATLAGASGLALGDFYEAVKEAGQGMRALGGNGEEAAQNFAKMQTEVRNTYGTFGMSNAEMAKASGTFVNLMGAAGHKGATAASLAAEAQGKTMNEMRKISIATGISMGKVMGSFKDLFAGRDGALLTASLSKMGQNTAEAAMKLARGASSFEAVFGDLGKDLYKQMKQAQAAGLSIINTSLGAEIAPYIDVRVFEQFAKASEEGGSAMVHASQQFAKSIEPNLATLKLQAATGDKAAMQMLEMYNNSKKFTSMADDEIAALDSKKRSEEKFATIQQKMSAAFETMYNKLFGFIDAIPLEVFETIGAVFEAAATAIGWFTDGLVTIFKVLGPVIAVLGGLFVAFKAITVAIGLLSNPVGWVIAGITALGLIVSNWDWISEGLMSLLSTIGDGLAAGVKLIWDIMTWPYRTFYKYMSGWIESIGEWFSSSWLKEGLMSLLSSIGDGLASGVKMLWDTMTWPYRTFYKYMSGWIESIGDWFSGSWIKEGLMSLIGSIGDGLASGVKQLWDIMTWPYRTFYEFVSGWINSIGDWFKSSWLGKKIFGDSGNSSSSSNGSVLASQGSSAGTTASNAQMTAKANVQADQAKTQSQTSEDMRRLVDINAAQHAQMERVASNTGQTKEAVERNGSTY